MKHLIIIVLLIFSFSGDAQEFKKLILTVKSPINKEIPIYIEPIDNDKVLATDYLRNSLTFNGFKVLTDKSQSRYIIRITCHLRADTGCGGYVLKTLEGQIIDGKNNAEILATFSFSQGNFEGKCTSDIMSTLAKKINAEVAK